MQRRIVLSIVFFSSLINLISSGPQQKWTIEVVEVKSYTSDPNVLELDCNIVRLGRAKFGGSGFWNLKVDLNDDALVQGTVQRSKHREGPFFAVPMAIDNETLSSVMNTYYKPLIQPIAEKCCKNAPIIEDKFEPPLTKRYIEANNCEMITDNFPNILMPGYYKVRMTLFQSSLESYLEGLFLVENITF